ncbi:MAG: 4Fe-4S dicluster domain-containing protein [Candidatus Aadella gelida]|nr:4Fe-4S dicluster domain-containing protein [Candidatus Aadella gelida]
MKNKDKTRPVINKERCKGCGLCINVCPMGSLTSPGEVNKKGLRYAILKNEDKCTGCGMCAVICPDCAIEMREREKKS